MLKLYSSKFAATAAHLKPVGSTEASRDCHCVLCAMPIGKGDLCTHYKDTSYMGEGFVDEPSAGARGEEQVCSYCIPLWAKEFLQMYSKSLVTKDGFFKIASNEDIASLLLSPPQEPFMAFISNAQQQHLIWRTPVNYSSEVFVIRMGTNLITIRHQIILDAVAAQKELLAQYKASLSAGKNKLVGVASSVFVGGDRELKSSTGYATNHKISAVGIELGMTDELEKINRLTLGERWAVATIGQSKLSAAVPLVKRLPA